MDNDDYAFADGYYSNLKMRSGYKSHLVDYYADSETDDHDDKPIPQPPQGETE